MKSMLSALLLACALLPAALLGGCAAQPEETLTKEQIDAISDKYGLESPAQQTEALTGADWGVSIKESPAAQP